MIKSPEKMFKIHLNRAPSPTFWCRDWWLTHPVRERTSLGPSSRGGCTTFVLLCTTEEADWETHPSQGRRIRVASELMRNRSEVCAATSWACQRPGWTAWQYCCCKLCCAHLKIFQVTMTTMTTMENFYCCIVISIVWYCLYCILYCFNHLCLVNSIVSIVVIAFYCNLVCIV